MRTPEDWIQIYMKLSSEEPRLRGWIKQIQLDAMKEGMRRAAEQMKKRCTHVDNGEIFWSNKSELDAHQAILTAAEQLTVDSL